MTPPYLTSSSPPPLSGSYPSVIINPLGRECIPGPKKTYNTEYNPNDLPQNWIPWSLYKYALFPNKVFFFF
jgi:hypothetical protein